MPARSDHGCLYELFADLAAHRRFDGDEAGEGGRGPVGGVGYIKGVHGKVDLYRSRPCGCGGAAHSDRGRKAERRDFSQCVARCLKWLLPIRAATKSKSNDDCEHITAGIKCIQVTSKEDHRCVCLLGHVALYQGLCGLNLEPVGLSILCHQLRLRRIRGRP